jgi:hypothetical protein
VEHAAAALAGAPARKAPLEHARFDVEQDDGIDRLADFAKQRLKPVGLDDRAREAVKDKTGFSIGAREALADDAEHGAVVHQVTRIHHGLRGAAEFRARCNGLAQEVTCGYLWYAVPRLHALRLRALARAGRPHQYKPHFSAAPRILRPPWGAHPARGVRSRQTARIGYASPPTGRVGARKTDLTMAARRSTGPRNALYAQSGGVTAVINATACGVIEACRRHKRRIGNLYAGRDGIVGVLTEDLIDTAAKARRRSAR